jgi:hypothetical protein
MSRVLAEYIDRFYVPSRSAVATLTADDRAALKRAMAFERELGPRWDGIVLSGLVTNVDHKETVSEGERIEVACRLDPNGLPAEALRVELFCLQPDLDEHTVVPMQIEDGQHGPAMYRCEFQATGRGRLSLNARVRPSASVLQDLRPDWIRWAQ